MEKKFDMDAFMVQQQARKDAAKKWAAEYHAKQAAKPKPSAEQARAAAARMAATVIKGR